MSRAHAICNNCDGARVDGFAFARAMRGIAVGGVESGDTYVHVHSCDMYMWYGSVI